MTYANLAAELVRNGIDFNEAAEKLEITSKTFRAKMQGKSDWTWTQVCILRRMFKTTFDLDYLFATSQPQKSA